MFYFFVLLQNKQHSSANNHSQNIYGLVEKARKTVRKSWSSLNQIRKLSVGNISNNFQLKIPGDRFLHLNLRYSHLELVFILD